MNAHQRRVKRRKEARERKPIFCFFTPVNKVEQWVLDLLEESYEPPPSGLMFVDEPMLEDVAKRLK